MSGNPRKLLASNTMASGAPVRKSPSIRSSSPSSQPNQPSRPSSSQNVARVPSVVTKPNRATISPPGPGSSGALVKSRNVELTAELAEAAAENETLRYELTDMDKRCQEYEQKLALYDTEMANLTAKVKTMQSKPAEPQHVSRGYLDSIAEMSDTNNKLRSELASSDIKMKEKDKQLIYQKTQIDDQLKDIEKLEEQLYGSQQESEGLLAQNKMVSQELEALKKRHREEMTAAEKELLRRGTIENELKDQNDRLFKAQRHREEVEAGRMMQINQGVATATRSGSHSRSSSVDANTSFAPPKRRDSSLNRNEVSRATRIISQKNTQIETLEKEIENLKAKSEALEELGTKLEAEFLDGKRENRRLQHENNEYQKILEERSLGGDLVTSSIFQVPSNNGSSSHSSSTKPGLGSLAEELPESETIEATRTECQHCRRLGKENEDHLRVIEDQAKYIRRITENALATGDVGIFARSPEDIIPPKKEKALPPPPPMEEAEAASSVQRSGSVFSGITATRRPRPVSQMIQPTTEQHPPWEGLARKARPMSQVYDHTDSHAPPVNEDKTTAPRIPITRGQSISVRTNGHRRTQSDKSDILNPVTNNSAAATVVNQMYRGPSYGSGAPVSPTLSPGGTTPQTSYFAPPALIGSHSNSNSSITGIRAPSSSMGTASSRPISGEKLNSSSASEISQDSEDGPSPPRTNQGYTNYTGAVMSQNKLRPLRLVQENKDNENANQLRRGMSAMADDEAAKKKANRSSWIGWFNKGKEEQAPPRNFGDGRF